MGDGRHGYRSTVAMPHVLRILVELDEVTGVRFVKEVAFEKIGSGA